jgi:hypothetical protein
MESGWEFQFQERMKSGGELSKLTNKQKHTFVPPPHTFERGMCLFPLAQRLCIWIDYYQCINLTKKAQPT